MLVLRLCQCQFMMENRIREKLKKPVKWMLVNVVCQTQFHPSKFKRHFSHAAHSSHEQRHMRNVCSKHPLWQKWHPRNQRVHWTTGSVAYFQWTENVGHHINLGKKTKLHHLFFCWGHGKLHTKTTHSFHHSVLGVQLKLLLCFLWIKTGS